MAVGGCRAGDAAVTAGNGAGPLLRSGVWRLWYRAGPAGEFEYQPGWLFQWPWAPDRVL